MPTTDYEIERIPLVEGNKEFSDVYYGQRVCCSVKNGYQTPKIIQKTVNGNTVYYQKSLEEVRKFLIYQLKTLHLMKLQEEVGAHPEYAIHYSEEFEILLKLKEPEKLI